MAEFDLAEKMERLTPILNEIRTEESRVGVNSAYAENLITVSESGRIKKPLWEHRSLLGRIFGSNMNREGSCPECSKTLHHKHIPARETAITVYWCDCCYQWAKWKCL